ncbi:MAG: BamA/TamA family outer membrane protein [Porphyromonas sp.]|nr:BamA/TamA family outer membrane protein [Porphyromonas sp.]
MKYPRPIVQIGVVLLALITFASCSTTKNLPKGEVLYTGIAKKTIINEDGSAVGQKALSAAENALNVAPNNSVFGSPSLRFPLPVGLWIYNAFADDSTLVKRKLFDMFASKPVLISAVNPSVRSLVARNVLREYGYFRAEVRDSLIYTTQDSLQAKVAYKIDLHEPFLYDSISFLPPVLLPDSTYFVHQNVSLLKPGEQFSLEKIVTDRNQVVSSLRNQGYYFYSPDLLLYQADTLLQPGRVHLRIREQAEFPEKILRPWTIGRIVVRISGSSGEQPTDSLTYDEMEVFYPEKLPVRAGELRIRIPIRRGDFYSQLAEEQLRESLVRLGAFSYVDLRFTPADSVLNVLDLQINTLLDKTWEASFDASFKSKSNNFVGPGLNLQLAKQNVFGGGEQLSFNLNGSYEWLINASSSNASRSDFHSYELGTDINLSAPYLLFPGLSNRFRNFSTGSSFTLSGSTLNRASFFRMNSFGLSASYVFANGAHRHLVAPLRLQYNFLAHRTAQFDEILDENPILKLSLNNQLIPQMSYTYTFDNVFLHQGSHRLWCELYIAQAGNILGGIYSLSGKKTPGESRKVVGVPFAQFLKTTGELRYTYMINRAQSLALRLGLGAIYSYGNSTVAPYNEQFFVGGANSIRAFTVRSVGPGRYVPQEGRYSFMDQSGEVKLELNAEFRLRLVGNLHGALFLDSGNVWLLRPDENRLGGSVGEIKNFADFINQIALGTGLGFRYDMDFVVIRLDAGVGLHLPYATSRKGYYNVPRFKDAFGVHFAIGYPF